MGRWEAEKAKEFAKFKKKLYDTVHDTVSSIYASLAKVLFEKYKMDADTIEDIFEESQKVWEENVDRSDSLIEWCEETTGILLKLRE